MRKTVRSISERLPVTFRSYRRGSDAAEFLRRGVVICPALFVNGRLAFYGAVTTREIVAYIRRHHPQHNILPLLRHAI